MPRKDQNLRGDLDKCPPRWGRSKMGNLVCVTEEQERFSFGYSWLQGSCEPSTCSLSFLLSLLLPFLSAGFIPRRNI
jgi:hypothetical protein